MIWLFLYISMIPLANWAIATFGVIPVGFGLMAPAGVMFAGFALTFRDLTQETVGRGRLWLMPIAILAGAALSLAVSPAQIALASATAFLVSELADWGIYTPLRQRGLIVALVASNVVGLVVDSALFLGLAFGSLDFLAGNVVAKLYTLLPAIGLMWRMRQAGYVKPVEATA